MADNDMNETFTVDFEDAGVITIPIDTTLSRSGEAADAKAVGDALAEKANRSELQTHVTVNHQEADAQGLIILLAAHIPVSSGEGAQSVAQVLNALNQKTGADIHVDDTPNAETIAQALANATARTAEGILMSDEDETTVAEAIGAVDDKADDNAEAIGDLQEAVEDELSDDDIDDIFSEVFEET